MSGLREFGLIRTTLWQSERFKSLEQLDARLAYMWLHTSYKTSAGVLRIGPPHLLDELDFVETLDRAEGIFEELKATGLIKRERPFAVITKYIAANPVKTYRHAIGAFKEVLSVPECAAKHCAMSELKKQKGAMELVNWRDKAGQPHQIIHRINAYFSDEMPDPEPLTNPSETPNDGFGRGTGRIENTEYKKEKGEQDHHARSEIAASIELQVKKKPSREGGPRPQTLALLDKMSP